MPVDLKTEALDAEEATCHVCGEPATLLVAKSDEIGSSIVFCDDDYVFAAQGDVASLGPRLAENYGQPAAEMKQTVDWLTTGLGRFVRID